MNHSSKNGDITLPAQNETTGNNSLPNDFYQEIFNADNLHDVKEEALATRLDSYFAVKIDGLVGQIELIHDFSDSVSRNETVDIRGYALARSMEAIRCNLNILEVIQSEIFKQFKNKECLLNEKISNLEQNILLLEKEVIEAEIKNRKGGAK